MKDEQPRLQKEAVPIMLQIWSIQEVCDYLHVSANTLIRIRNTKPFPEPVGDITSKLFRAKDVIAYAMGEMGKETETNRKAGRPRRQA